MNIKSTLFDNHYYWQHQNQLQPSALTFDALVQDKKAPAAPNLETSNTKASRPVDKTSENASLITTRVVTIESLTPTKIIPRRFDMDALINHINKRLDTPMAVLKPEIRSTGFNPTKAMTQPFSALPQACFKHHHLFIDEDNIELALNTRALSQRESNELQRTIKQWLLGNGYILKTLIINGVPQ